MSNNFDIASLRVILKTCDMLWMNITMMTIFV